MGFVGTSPALPLTPELKELYTSLQRCLDLRDKYMSVSLQRLGDDPRHYDGTFTGPPTTNSASEANKASSTSPKAWKIYPPPPPPHWKFKASNTRTPEISHAHDDGDVPFEFSSCEIPSQDPWDWEMDEKGVIQVYEDTNGKCRRFRVD